MWETSPSLILNHPTGRKAGRPGPLKIVTAEPTGHVYNLTNKKQARHLCCFHCLRRKFPGRYSAECHLGAAIAFCIDKTYTPLIDGLSDRAYFVFGQMINCFVDKYIFCNC